MGGRILVVEDNQDNMMLIVDLLRSLKKYEVLKAADGEQCLQVAAAERPDLILMDLSLPRMDGWTATRLLKADPALKSIPVIALTAHAMVGDRERAFQAGCDDYVTKPINLRGLAAKLDHFLQDH